MQRDAERLSDRPEWKGPNDAIPSFQTRARAVQVPSRRGVETHALRPSSPQPSSGSSPAVASGISDQQSAGPSQEKEGCWRASRSQITGDHAGTCVHSRCTRSDA